MSLKDISYLELWQPLCLVERNHLCNFGRRHHEKQFCEKKIEFGPVVQKEMLFKDISYLELWQPFCSVERNHLCNSGKGHFEEHFLSRALAASPFLVEQNHLCIFGRRHHEEQFCNITLIMEQWFRGCRLKIFLIWSSGSPFDLQRGTSGAILVEGIIRNNSLKLF